MGVYDTLHIPCANCGKMIEEQTKEGDCTLSHYTLEEIPANMTTNPDDLQTLMYSQPNNSRKVYGFTRGVSNYTGEYGWKPSEINGFDPVAPPMIPHDLMEHFPGDEHEPHGEYQAQGAMLYLRHALLPHLAPEPRHGALP